MILERAKRNKNTHSHMSKRAVYKMCTKKRRYANESKATEAAKHCRAKNAGAVNLRVYYCDVCEGWHITKREIES